MCARADLRAVSAMATFIGLNFPNNNPIMSLKSKFLCTQLAMATSFIVYFT